MLQQSLELGDKIHIGGHSTDFTQAWNSWKWNIAPSSGSKPGDDVAVKVAELVHEHNLVYKVVE